MDVIGDNIANVNTTGFKSGRVNFSEILSQSFRGSTYSQVGANISNPAQIGLGVTISSIDNNFAQGGSQTTGRTLDLELIGDGFFEVSPMESESASPPDNPDDTTYYTRDGAFYIDNDSYLVNSSGLFVLNQDQEMIQFPNTDTIESISIDKYGRISYIDKSTGEKTDLETIGVAIFNNPEALAKAGGNLYQNPNPGITPATNSTGYIIQSGALEMSNTDLTAEFTNMITTQRGYQANARVITTSDQMLGELIDLKR
jgi:flagellar hook protein FlgE